jgi:hypothetical protein
VRLEHRAEDNFPGTQPANLHSLSQSLAARSTAYQSGPCPGPSWAAKATPFPALGKAGVVPLASCPSRMLDLTLSPAHEALHPHPLHLNPFGGQISPRAKTKQCEQLNARSRKKFKKCLSLCCTEQFHFLRSLACWPLFSSPVVPACLLQQSLCVCGWWWGAPFTGRHPSEVPSTGRARRGGRETLVGVKRWVQRDERFLAESTVPLLCSTSDLWLWLQDAEEGRR